MGTASHVRHCRPIRRAPHLSASFPSVVRRRGARPTLIRPVCAVPYATVISASRPPLVCRSRSFEVLVVDGELEVLALAANILQGEGYTSTQRLGMTSPPPKPVGTILVVDDDQEVLAVAVDMLEMARYTVLSTA